jgi:hypothetical protein
MNRTQRNRLTRLITRRKRQSIVFIVAEIRLREFVREQQSLDWCRHVDRLMAAPVGMMQ